jgi:hypothetical protein
LVMAVDQQGLIIGGFGGELHAPARRSIPAPTRAT